MVAPVYRYMDPGEEFLIEAGIVIKIELPNGTVLSIQAD